MLERRFERKHHNACTWYKGEVSKSSVAFLDALGFVSPSLDFATVLLPAADAGLLPPVLIASLDGSRTGLALDGTPPAGLPADFGGGAATAGNSPRAFSSSGVIVFLETGDSFSVALRMASNPMCFMMGRTQSWAGLRTSADLEKL